MLNTYLKWKTIVHPHGNRKARQSKWLTLKFTSVFHTLPSIGSQQLCASRINMQGGYFLVIDKDKNMFQKFKYRSIVVLCTCARSDLHLFWTSKILEFQQFYTCQVLEGTLDNPHNNIFFIQFLLWLVLYTDWLRLGGMFLHSAGTIYLKSEMKKKFC